jgi:hypothetical protein
MLLTSARSLRTADRRNARTIFAGAVAQAAGFPLTPGKSSAAAVAFPGFFANFWRFLSFY